MKKPGTTKNGSRKNTWKRTDVTIARASVRVARSLGSSRRVRRMSRFTG